MNKKETQLESEYIKHEKCCKEEVMIVVKDRGETAVRSTEQHFIG
jgi:hypothetical protein